MADHIANLNYLADKLFELDYQQMGAEARLAADEIERLRAALDEAREAAREMAGYRPVDYHTSKTWEQRFPWLNDE